MRYCGRDFSDNEIRRIRELIAGDSRPSRYALSVAVCKELSWRRLSGGLKDMSCRVALLRMQSDGLIELPAARCARPTAKGVDRDFERVVEEPTTIPTIDLARLTVELVASKRVSLLWNSYMQRHHYLGHQLMPGAQLRYFVKAEGVVVALLSFGASAWKVKPRDDHIGWTKEQRQRNLHLVVNNARFLILPWIFCPNLASKVLATIARRIGDDWQARYAYRPVLLETFVEDARLRDAA